MASALLGILLFILIILGDGILHKISIGEHGQHAMQMLNNLRRPILEIKQSEIQVQKDNDIDVAIMTFEQAVNETQYLLQRYRDTASYNPIVLERIDILTLLINKWVEIETSLWRIRSGTHNETPSYQGASTYQEQHAESLRYYYLILDVLGLGETPIYDDIDKGREASRLLQWSGAALMFYLFFIFALFQRTRHRELLDAYHDVDKTRDQLAGREKYFSLILDAIGDGVIATDTDGKIIRMNPVAEYHSGWNEEQAQNKPLSDVFKMVNTKNREPLESPLNDVLTNGAIVGMANDTILISKNGTEYLIANSSAPIKDDNDNILGAILVFRNITDEYKLQRKINEQAQRLQSIVASALDAIITADENDCITEWNPQAEAVFGWSRKDAVGNTLTNTIIPGEYQQAHQQGLSRFLKNGISTITNSRIETYAKHHDGHQFPIELSVIPLYQNGAYKFTAFIRDLTKSKHAEAELLKYREHLEELVAERTTALEATNKELEAFSYSVSHDLRAPLRSINGFTQAILEDYFELFDDAGKDYLKRIFSASQHMSDLIDDMLMLSRLTRGEFINKKVNLSNLAKHSLETLQDQDKARKINYSIQPDIIVDGDQRLLNIVLDNLMNNAWKYTSKTENPYIEFGAVLKEGKTVYYVKDNGAGFDMQFAGKLFGAFQRLHGNDFEGTGIGLATVQRIIHRHAGHVWAKAEPNKGATFFFTLNAYLNQK